jgi:hypothetical protein
MALRKKEEKYFCVLENIPTTETEFKIERCKQMVERKIGLEDDSDLDDTFQFIFPVIGPLSKSEYLKQVKQFDLEKMFPGMYENLYYNFNIDPYETNRVWFTSRLITTHAGDGPFGKATQKKIDCPPQMNSLTFNEEGKIIRYTGGYVMDRTIGNTGGLGGVFGILYALGKPLPFPEAQPYQKSLSFRLFSWFSNKN